MNKLKIHIYGENLPSKEFYVDPDSTVGIIKKLVVARIAYNGKYVKPAWDHCQLTKNKKVLDNIAKAKDVIQEGDRLFIQVYFYCQNRLMSISEVLKNKNLQFVKANPTKLDYLRSHYGNVTNLLRSVSSVATNNEQEDSGGFYYRWD